MHKSYTNSNHSDSLDVTGNITSGSSRVFVNGKALAYNGSTISADGCNGVAINQGSNNVFCS